MPVVTPKMVMGKVVTAPPVIRAANSKRSNIRQHTGGLLPWGLQTLIPRRHTTALQDRMSTFLRRVVRARRARWSRLILPSVQEQLVLLPVVEGAKVWPPTG